MHKHAIATTKPPYLINSFASLTVFVSSIEESNTTIKFPSILKPKLLTN